jgi:hypothetical protein
MRNTYPITRNRSLIPLYTQDMVSVTLPLPLAPRIDVQAYT